MRNCNIDIMETPISPKQTQSYIFVLIYRFTHTFLLLWLYILKHRVYRKRAGSLYLSSLYLSNNLLDVHEQMSIVFLYFAGFQVKSSFFFIYIFANGTPVRVLICNCWHAANIPLSVTITRKLVVTIWFTPEHLVGWCANKVLLLFALSVSLQRHYIINL